MTLRPLVLAAFGAFLAGLVAFLPLALFVPVSGSSGLVHGGVSGTLWRGGAVESVIWHGVPLGRVTLDPAPVTLLTGSVGGQVKIAGSFLEASGTLSAGKETSLEGGTMSARLAGFRLPLPVDGTLDLSDVSATLRGERCTAATGKARLVARMASGSGASLAFPVLEGPLACEDGTLVLRLAGRDGGASLGLAAWIEPTGHYRYTADLATDTPEVRRLLPYMGFVANGNGFKLIGEGRWQKER